MRQIVKAISSEKCQDHIYKVTVVSVNPQILWPRGFAVHTKDSLAGVEVDIYRNTGNASEIQVPSKSGIVNRFGVPVAISKTMHHYKYNHSKLIEPSTLARSTKPGKEKANE